MEFSVEFNMGKQVPRTPPDLPPTTIRYQDRVTVDHPLWPMIRDLVLDDPQASMGFTARLARDHHWTAEHAGRVVFEYRRFLFLAATATATEPVTPSEEVDEAWHLHLAYTRSYWDDLCTGILGGPLHHGPTGGSEDMEGFRLAYDATLARYHRTFGKQAPVDIWPPATERFDLGMGFRTVPLRDFWVLRRRWPVEWNAGLVVGVFCLLLMGSLMLGPLGPVPEVSLAFVPITAGVLGMLVIGMTDRQPGRPFIRRKVEDPRRERYDPGPASTGSDGGSGCGGCGGCG